MDLIQTRQEHSLATAVMLLTIAVCGLLYVLAPPQSPAMGTEYQLDRALSLELAKHDRR